MSGRYIPNPLRLTVIQRAGGRCEYCRSLRANAIHPFHIDHIVPLDAGGASKEDNLALSCGGCNSAKGRILHVNDLLTGREVPLYHPRKQRWQDHFKWSDDFLEIIGISPIGRVTILQLRLNRQGLYNMRRLTLISGEHPPNDYMSTNE